MNGFGIVYALDMSPNQLLLSKVHSNFSLSDKITKFWQVPSFTFAFQNQLPNFGHLLLLSKIHSNFS